MDKKVIELTTIRVADPDLLEYMYHSGAEFTYQGVLVGSRHSLFFRPWFRRDDIMHAIEGWSKVSKVAHGPGYTGPTTVVEQPNSFELYDICYDAQAKQVLLGVTMVYVYNHGSEAVLGKTCLRTTGTPPETSSYPGKYATFDKCPTSDLRRQSMIPLRFLLHDVRAI